MALLLVVLALGVAAVFMYNGLARLRLLVANAWADIDVQLKRRHDLVPQLVATVKGHAGYEKGTLEELVAARGRALQAGGPAAAGEAERVLGGQVRQVLAVAEAYPDLQAAQSYLALQKSLTEIEDTIQNARRYYNAVVRDFNIRIQQFPSNVIAGLFGFHAAEFFGLKDDAEGAVPSLDLGEEK